MKKYYWLGGYMILAMLIALLISFALPVQAATPAPPTVTPCVKVAEATTEAGGLIENFRCVDEDTGTVFYQNSLGFMVFPE